MTNLSYQPKGITHFFNGRGMAERRLKEGKYALNWTWLVRHARRMVLAGRGAGD